MMKSEKSRWFKHGLMYAHLIFFSITLTVLPSKGHAESYWNVLAEYSQVASGINALFDASLQTAGSSADNNVNAMNALKNYWKYKTPIDQKYDDAILEFADYHDFNNGLYSTNKELQAFRTINYDKSNGYTLWKNRLGNTFGNAATSLSLCMEAYSFGEHLSKAIDAKSNTVRVENVALLGLNLINAYQTSIELAENAARFFPKTPAESWWAKNTFAKGFTRLMTLTPKGQPSALLGGLSGVLVGAQIESAIYKHLRDKEINEIKDNVFFEYSDIRNSRVRIISQLIQMCIDKEIAGQSVTVTDITNILHWYNVLRPMHATAHVGQAYKLEDFFYKYMNNISHLSNNYNATSFDALSDTQKIMVALDALALMADIEDAEIRSYLNTTFANGAKAADVIFAAFEGGSMYEIYNTADLMNKMFPYNDTGVMALTYYDTIFKVLFNSGHATRKFTTLAEIGRYSAMLKAAEDEQNRTNYLEIQLPDKDVATGVYATNSFYAAKGSKIRLVPRNDPAWPDFSVLQGAQIEIAVVYYNEFRTVTLAGTYHNGTVEFNFDSTIANEALTSSQIELLAISAVLPTGRKSYSESNQQFTEIPTFGSTIDTSPSGTIGTIVIDEQFNGTSLNSNIWSTSGYTVSEHDGYLDLQAAQTDNVGYATAKFPPMNRLRVEMRHIMHTEPNYWNVGDIYFFPSIGFGSSDSQKGFGVTWMKSYWGPDYCNDSNYFNKIQIGNTTGTSCNATFTDLTSSDYFDTWITSIINYDLTTGLISLDVDGDGVVDYNATQVEDRRGAIQSIRLSPYGWWTGHYHKIDYIKISGDYAPIPITTFLSENLADGTYQVGTATKTWRFKSGANGITGLKAVQVPSKTHAGLGISQTEITVGDVATNTEFSVNLPINPAHDSTDVKSSYWTLVDGNGTAVTITNSKNNDFWLKLRTNRAPQFSQLQLESLGGKIDQSVCLPLLTSDPDGDNLTYSVTTGGGSVIDGTCMGTTGKIYQNSFSTLGVLPITIRISDNTGAADSRELYAIITSDGAVKDFFNDLKNASATTDQLKDQYRAINYLALKGIVIGLKDPDDPNGRVFKANTFANQAEALSMLIKAASIRGLIALDADIFPLKNLSKHDPATGTYYNFSWATPYVFKSQQLGLISSAAEFEPNKAVTREWFASILAALLKLDPPIDLFTTPAAYSFADATSFSTPYDYDKARAAAVFGLMGQLGSTSPFYPRSSMVRADVAVVVSKLLRRPTLSGITTAGLSNQTLAGETVPSLQQGQSFTVTGVTGLSGNRMLDDGAGNIKEDQTNAAAYTTVKVIRPGMAPYLAGSQLASTFATTPVTVQTSPPEITYSGKRPLVVLVQTSDADGSNVVSNMTRMDYGVIFPDTDGDRVRDDLDLWPTNQLYAYDTNANGIPDNADALWNLSAKNASQAVNINGTSMTMINAVLNNVLANDKTAPTTGITITGSASPLTVTLAVNETAEIRYTSDGSTPSATSTLYTAPLSLATGTKLNFFAADLAGNHEAIRTVTIQGSGDTAPPLFSSFTAPLYSSSLLVSVAIDAADNIAITGWCLNESGSSSTCTWSANKPTSFTLAGQGVRTLFVFAKDAVGNIGSSSANIEVAIPDQILTVTVTGTGAGTVTNNPAGTPGIPCTSGICSDSYPYNTVVSIMPTPNAISIFGGWSGTCSNLTGNCLVTMITTRSVTATFTKAPKAKIGEAPFETLNLAYIGAAASGSTILVLDTELTESLNMNSGKAITLKGGYKADYSGKSGLQTVLKGVLTIGTGSLIVEGITIK